MNEKHDKSEHLVTTADLLHVHKYLQHCRSIRNKCIVYSLLVYGIVFVVLAALQLIPSISQVNLLSMKGKDALELCDTPGIKAAAASKADMSAQATSTPVGEVVEKAAVLKPALVEMVKKNAAEKKEIAKSVTTRNMPDKNKAEKKSAEEEVTAEHKRVEKAAVLKPAPVVEMVKKNAAEKKEIAEFATTGNMPDKNKAEKKSAEEEVTAEHKLVKEPLGKQAKHDSAAIADSIGVMGRNATQRKRGVKRKAKIHSNITPVYPFECREQGQEGKVVCEVWISGSGSLTRVKVTKSSGVGPLDEAAVAFLQQASYSPAENYFGEAVASQRKFTINFKLDG